MRILFIIILSIFLSGCKLNKIVNHHGVHNLEEKSNNLLINVTKRENDAIKILLFNICEPVSTLLNNNSGLNEI